MGLYPNIPSFYLLRGGGRFLLLNWVVALMGLFLLLLRCFSCHCLTLNTRDLQGAYIFELFKRLFVTGLYALVLIQRLGHILACIPMHENAPSTNGDNLLWSWELLHGRHEEAFPSQLLNTKEYSGSSGQTSLSLGQPACPSVFTYFP